MRFIRFRHNSAVEMRGIADNDTVQRIHGSFFQNFTVTQDIYDFHTITLLPPVLPQTIACCGENIQSYIKSPASLCAGGELKDTTSKEIYCIPRIGFVLKKTNIVEIFGVLPVLDFITAQDTATLSASAPCRTMIGPSMRINFKWENSAPEFMLNAKRFSYTPDKKYMKQQTEAALSAINFISGDIIAVAFDRSHLCKTGDEISLSFDEEEALKCKIV